MTNHSELLVSAHDAESLAPILGDRRPTGRFEADAADALADLLLDARMVPHDRLPADRVAINSRVTYREEPRGEPRTVVLAHPRDANASEGRISVLSPVGRALLGRGPGAVSTTDMPGGQAMRIRVLAAERLADPDAA
ncbi:MAG: GreA/GreB family elongation factor [Burkholderiales bacterium]